MQKQEMKSWGLRILIILALIAGFQIVRSIVKGMKKPVEVVYNVANYTLKKTMVAQVMSIQGIVQGNPQVKVYPQVPGKFARNEVSEGQMVSAGQVIAYLDRDIVGATFELAPVKAPISGIVTKLYYVDKGDTVSPQMPVAEIANEDNIKVMFNVGQDTLLKLKKGQKARISYITDQAVYMDGEVASVPPVVDTDIMAGTVIVKAVNRGRTMKIGMSVNVDITYAEQDSFMVPEKAVLLGENVSYVFMQKDGVAKMVNVTMGYRMNDMIEIKGPLTEGDVVITDGNFKLYDGVKVSSEMPADAKDTAAKAAATAVPGIKPAEAK